jgi:NHL repeat
MHVLPRVRELEERFAEELVVIGVHAGKFSAERRTRNIEAACKRLGVHHAVVNDRQFRIWKAYAVRAWPTVALIDAAGMLVGVQSGEFPVDTMAEAIAAIVARDRERGLIRPATRPARPPAVEDGSVIRFPTRVIAEGGRRWVSAAGRGHVCEFEVRDGDTWRLTRMWQGFVEPQGLARLDGVTFVADRRGHSVFRLEEDGAATRIAGTGRIGEHHLAPGAAAELDLRSPWGLSALPNGDIGIAMAGSHQLWRLERDGSGGFDEAILSLLAGAGGEDILDGPADTSLLAQPTGMALDGPKLAFADCESSAVRLLDLTDAAVGTLVGTGLFDFGDRDGVGDEVLLQHAQDLAWWGDEIVVADTYNDRLKIVDPRTRHCEPYPGEAGEAGSLWEPMGISAHDGELLVADTNNHRIVRVAPDGGISPVRIEE